MIITAYKLWENGVFTGSCPMQLNCDRLQGQPYRPAWLVLTGCCSPVNFQLTFREPVAGTYFLSGILVNYMGSVIVLDAVSIDALVAACDQCCDPADVTVEGVYNGVLPPLPVPPGFALYMIQREDNGTISALDKAMRDYYGQYSLYYPFNRTSYVNGVSTYVFYSDKIPFAIEPDTVGPFSADYETNDAPTLGGGEWYVLAGDLGGAEVIPLKATTLSGIVAIANQLDYFQDAGTWSVDGTRIKLSGSHYESGNLTLITETIPSVVNTLTNVAPVPDPGEELALEAHLNIGVYDIGTLPPENGEDIAELLAAIQADPLYSLLGTWSLVNSNTQIQLASSLITGGNMDIVTQPMPSFSSNTAPTLTAGQWFTFTGTIDAQGYYIVKATSLATLATLLNNVDDYKDAGFWTVDGQTIKLESDDVTTASLVIAAETIPAVQNFLSNAVDPLPAGANYVLNGNVQFSSQTVGTITNIIADTLSGLVSQLQANPLFNNIGGWASVNADTQLQLSSSYITAASLVITLELAPGTVVSNDAPTLAGGEWYTLTATHDGPGPYVLKAVTLQELVALAFYANVFKDWGDWMLSGDKIYLTPDPIPTSATLVIGKETIPATVDLDSNVAPVLPGGDVYQLVATLNIDTVNIATYTKQAATLALLVTAFEEAPDASLMGTWHQKTADTISLTSSLVTDGTLVISTVTP